MLSEDKIRTFLKLQQILLDMESGQSLIDKFLPQVFKELAVINLSYEFLSAIFVDQDYQVQKSFFVDKQIETVPATAIINFGNIFEKGSNWEMELLYGRPIVISDIPKILNNTYHAYANIHSVLVCPIKSTRKLAGAFLVAGAKEGTQISSDEIEFIQMINRLIDIAYRLEDTESSLTKITQQVYEVNAKLHQLDKLKDDFVSIASHELRTPMTAIRSYAWMALHKSDIPLSDKLQRYLVRVLISTERLINLVNDMLNISRIESGKIEIKPEPVDLLSLIKDIVDEVYYSKSTDKKFEFEILEKPVPKIFADPNKLRQVLLNLVGNSIKFTPMNGKIIFDFFSDGKTVEIAVKDTGVGISKEDLGRLFHKFSRLDSSYTAVSTSGGTGLGLYISKNLVELMHGRIWASSEGTGKGTIMTVSLPVATPDVLANAQSFTVVPKGEVKGLEPVSI